MKANEVMAAFAAEMGQDGIEPDEDGIYAVELDGMEVSFTADDGRLITFAAVGELPPEGREGLLVSMMEAMHLTDDAIFSIDPDAGTVCLQRFDELAFLDYEDFRTRLESFVNLLEEWQGRFASAQEGVTEESPEDIEVPELGTGVGTQDGLIMV